MLYQKINLRLNTDFKKMHFSLKDLTHITNYGCIQLVLCFEGNNSGGTIHNTGKPLLTRFLLRRI